MRPSAKFWSRSASLLPPAALLVVGLGFWMAHHNPFASGSTGIPTLSPRTPAVVQAAPESSPTPATTEEILIHASRDDLLTALRNRLAAGASREEVHGILQLLACRRPTMAAELATAIGRDEIERRAFTGAVLEVWSRTDPDAAWGWILTQNERLDVAGELSLQALVLNGVAAIDPQKVVALVEGQMRLRADQPGLVALSADLVRDAVEAWLACGELDLARCTTEQWANSDGHNAVGNAALERIALQLASRSPAEAAEWLMGLPASEDRNQALATLAAARAATDAPAAMAWAASLGVDDGRADAMQRVFNRWGETDVVGAAQWLADHESHPMTDRLITNLIEDASLVQISPSLALEWVGLIADPGLRLQATSQVVLAWGKKNPSAALGYVNEDTSLPISEKSLLLRVLQMPRSEPAG